MGFAIVKEEEEPEAFELKCPNKEKFAQFIKKVKATDEEIAAAEAELNELLRKENENDHRNESTGTIRPDGLDVR